MRISGNEPSSVILNQTKYLKKSYQTHKIAIQINFNTELLLLSKRFESTEVDRRFWLHVP